MAPHKKWFSRYENNIGGDVFLEDDSTTKIIRCGRVILFLKHERIRTLPRVLYILDLARNLICVSKLGDASVQYVFEKEISKMVRGALVLKHEVRIGNLYKLLGITFNGGCNKFVVPKGRNVEGITTIVI